MQTVYVNGQAMHTADHTSITALLAALAVQGRIAVEVNGTTIPRSCHNEHTLVDGDRVEIVHAIGGG